MLLLRCPRPRRLLPPKAVITLPSSPPAPPAPVPSDPSVVLNQAANELSRLREDLRSADPRLVVGRLELASGWARSAASVRAALSQAAFTSNEEKQAARQAMAARDGARATLRMPGAAARRWRLNCKACVTSSRRRSASARRRRRR